MCWVSSVGLSRSGSTLESGHDSELGQRPQSTLDLRHGFWECCCQTLALWSLVVSSRNTWRCTPPSAASSRLSPGRLPVLRFTRKGKAFRLLGLPPSHRNCRGRDDPHGSPTGWPKAVTCLRLPQNPACRFPALGSSEVDSQYGDSLQLFIGVMQLRSKQWELFLDPLKLLPTNRTVPAPTAQHFAPVAFHG